MDHDHVTVASHLLDRVQKRPIGDHAFCWDLNYSMPIAPTIEESLRIAMQEWDSDSVAFYTTNVAKDGSVSLSLCNGMPIHLDGVSDLMLVVHTDTDHRFHWRVTELSSSSAVSKPKPTEKDALDAAQRALTRFGPDGFRAAIRSVREGHITAFRNGTRLPSTITAVAPDEASRLKALGVKVEVGDRMVAIPKKD